MVAAVSSLVVPAALAGAQDSVARMLEARLIEKGLPVKEFAVGEWPSAVARVVLQSASSTDKLTPEDPGYEHAVDRVFALALRDGLRVSLFDLTIVNTAGKPIHWTLGMPVNRAFVSRAYPASKMGETEVGEWVRQALPLRDLALDDVRVARDADGWSEVDVRLSAPDVEAANSSLGAFMRETLDRIEAFNAGRSGQVATVRIEVVDGRGRLLLRHVRDYQLWQEHWWQAEGMTNEWFPSPLPAQAEH
jgi:hypothetical protein